MSLFLKMQSILKPDLETLIITLFPKLNDELMDSNLINIISEFMYCKVYKGVAIAYDEFYGLYIPELNLNSFHAKIYPEYKWSIEICERKGGLSRIFIAMGYDTQGQVLTIGTEIGGPKYSPQYINSLYNDIDRLIGTEKTKDPKQYSYYKTIIKFYKHLEKDKYIELNCC